MDKKTLFLISLVALTMPLAALAQLQPYAPGAVHVGSLTDLVQNIERAAGFIFGAIAVLCFLVAGILFLSAGGQPEKLKIARNAVIWGIAGVVVGIVAFSIIAIVGSFIT